MLHIEVFTQSLEREFDITLITTTPGVVYKVTKINNELGWNPSFSFEEGMEQTVEWYANHQEWCENVTTGKYQRERLGI